MSGRGGMPNAEEMVSLRLTAVALIQARLTDDDAQLAELRPGSDDEAFWLYLIAADLCACVLRAVRASDRDELLKQMREQIIRAGVIDEGSVGA